MFSKQVTIFIAAMVFLSCSADLYSAERKLDPKTAKKFQRELVSYAVDDFNDGTHLESPEWWRFGNLYLSVIKNDKKEFKHLGKHSLRVQGVTDQWYVGGCGTYLGLDMLPYNALKLVIFSKGMHSALLKIELYDCLLYTSPSPRD